MDDKHIYFNSIAKNCFLCCDNDEELFLEAKLYLQKVPLNQLYVPYIFIMRIRYLIRKKSDYILCYSMKRNT